MGLSKLLSDTRLAIVNLAKVRGGITASQAVDATGLSKSTIREHLHRLEELGLVESTADRSGRGRPSHLYSLTDLGERLFPSRDGEVARELVAFLHEKGEADLITEFFETFWRHRRQEFRLRCELDGAETLAEKLDVLDTLLDEQGFLPDIELDDGDVTICESHCPFSETVKATGIPCRLEAEFMESIVGAEPHRVTFRPDGASACTYTFDVD